MPIWNIGAISVTRIEEQLGFAKLPPERYLVGFQHDVLERHLDWLVPNHYSPEYHRFVTSVHSWLIRTKDHTILLDCCAGNHKDRPWTPRFHQLDTPYLQRLRAAGVAPEDIDIVLCTHLHADHVGWNTVLKDGRWVPTFPNARYLFSEAEAGFWDERRNPEIRHDPRFQAYTDSVLPVIAAGQSELIREGYCLDGGLSIVAAPGHTPGHIILRVVNGGSHGVFCGDAIHHALQIYAPDWSHAADDDPDEARETRRALLEFCVEMKAALFPTHFGAPHVTHVLGAPNGFRAKFIRGSE